MGNLDRYYDLPTERPFKADPDERSFEADQGERPFKADQGKSSERVFRFPGTTPSATSSRGCVAALDLVSQAAEVIKGIENHASESEKHVRSIADKALQRLQLAESRIEELETELQSAQACIREARVKIKESTEFSELREIAPRGCRKKNVPN